MDIRIGETVPRSFTVHNAAGLLQNADSLPTAVIRLNGASDATVVTITNVATGHYQASFTAPGGWANDDYVEVIATAIVDGDTDKAPIGAFTVRKAPLTPTVDSRELDVTATGAAGIDLANVENPTTALNLSGTTINLVNTLTTYTGNTPQTGDAFARLGAPAGASISADIAAKASQVSVDTVDGIVDAILLDTAEIGAAGAGLTDLGGMSTTMKAQIESEANDALVAYDAATGADVSAVNPDAETRDLRPVAANNTLKMVQKATGVLSANAITIFQGETKRCAFDCASLLPPGEVLASMAAPTASVANLTPTEVGIDATQAKFTLACGAAVAAGDYTVRTTITTDPDLGPILIIGTVTVLED